MMLDRKNFVVVPITWIEQNLQVQLSTV